MADNRVDEAVDIVARRMIQDVTEPDALGDLWESYPDLGEHDFRAVVGRAAETVLHVVGVPTFEEYRAAYDYLSARANDADQ